MLQDLKVQELQVMPPVPMYTAEFLRMVQDFAYETLRAHLLNTHQNQAAQLLDDIIILTMPPPPQGNSSWIYNQCLSEAIGKTTHHVTALGGNFVLQSK